MPTEPLTIGIELRDLTLPFMFESSDGSVFVLPINPESYTKEMTPLAKFTLTQAGGFEDRTGWGPPAINLKGTFGYLGTHPGGNAKTINNSIPQSGWELYKEIETVFLDFYAQFGTYTDTGELNLAESDTDAKIKFYNFTDEDFYEVQINKFLITRSIQHRTIYKYDIQLTALRRLDEEEALEIDYLLTEFETLRELPTEADVSFWDTLLEGYTWISETMTSVTNQFNEVKGTLSTIRTSVSAFRQGVSDLISAPFELIQDAITTVDSILDTISSLEDLPHEFTDLLRETKYTLLTYKTKKDLFNPDGDAPVSVADTSGTQEVLTAPLPSGQISEDSGAVSMHDPDLTLFDPELNAVAEVAALETPISRNDTLETIAARLLGNSTEWKRIATLNNLEYPYILSSDDPKDFLSETKATGTLSSGIAAESTEITPSGFTFQAGNFMLLIEGALSEIVEIEGVANGVASLASPTVNAFTVAAIVTLHEEELALLKPGAKIKVPGNRTSNVAVASTVDDRAFYDQLYGVDELLDDNGFLVATQTGELATIGGLPNLQVQLEHRLKTTLKALSHLGHITYGSINPELIGKMGSPIWHERAKLEGKLTLLRDPRIRGVGRSTFTIEGDSIYLDADVFPINKETSEKLRISV